MTTCRTDYCPLPVSLLLQDYNNVTVFIVSRFHRLDHVKAVSLIHKGCVPLSACTPWLHCLTGLNTMLYFTGWNTTKLYHGYTKPSARLISTQIMSTHEIQSDTRYTSFIMQWGQFLDHDLTLTPMSVSRARYVCVQVA